MLENIIIIALFNTAILHLMYKWKIKNPLNCEFCLSFWIALISFCIILERSWLNCILVVPFSLCSAVLSFYLIMRINIYANNKNR